MIEHDLRVERFLRSVLPDGWQPAAEQAAQLGEGLRYLPWCDRLRAIDGFLWAEAQARLVEGDVTAIINRQTRSIREPLRLAGYTLFCRAVITAFLLEVGEGEPTEAPAAILHHFSLEQRHQQAAEGWLGREATDGLASCLRSAPGCAFFLLILSPSDSAMSFLARDAFWAAMLGRG